MKVVIIFRVNSQRLHHRLNYDLKSATTAKMRQNYVCKGSLLYLITKKVLIFSGKSGNNFGRI
jgi:hypothetical protein